MLQEERVEQPKDTMDSQTSVPSRRGRPKMEGAMSGAERARRYREKQKAAGLTKRYVTENIDTDPEQDVAFWMAENQRLKELLRQAISKHDYFQSEVARLHKENDDLLDRARSAEYANTVSLKDLIVMRHKLREFMDSETPPRNRAKKK